ncbi:MAG: NAD(P)H-dependent oxidoreductase subunit E [Bacteroidales bacterium]|nr:NAD(P)H-dependent oxidoreductase subunit E [Lentimicrobiaceae bacterium]MDD5693802.1 NAD(P)H-dependent oxidoreductase subunit E [Bacteroidales bacterium]
MNPEESDISLTTGIKSFVEELAARNKNLLIAILEDVQKRYNYLPEKILKEVSAHLGIPIRDIYGVATFYKAFSLKPRGRHLVSACMGTACHVRGTKSVVGEIEKQLGIKSGETTPDNLFTFETVNCLGACALGPIVVVDGKYTTSVKKQMVRQIIEKTLRGEDLMKVEDDKRIFPLILSCPRCNHTLMDNQHTIDGYPSIRVTISFNGMHGWYRLSSLYGSFKYESEYPRPIGSMANYFCPHCHSELLGYSKCPECGTGMVPMIVTTGGIVHICPKRGCKGHILDI